MIPVIALVGRPNVGKSTIFNVLTRSRDALVADLPGLTRDRKYGEGDIKGQKFIVIDTGGISGDEKGIDAAMAEQSLLAVEEADVVFFVVDAQAGLTAADEMIAHHLRVANKDSICHSQMVGNHLRVANKDSILVVNKVDGMNTDVAASDFYKLGFAEPRLTAAAHNRGVRSLIEDVLAELPEQDEPLAEEAEKGIKIGIIGRPNVGKSTLVNRMLGEDRVVVYDHPGTTRDSVYIPYERHGKPYTIIDTAGVRRRKNVKEAVEKFSIIKTLQAIEDANVVVFVLDAREGVVDQDLHLIGFVLDSGRALVVAVNKWDGMNQEDRDRVKSELERRLHFLPGVDVKLISALHGTGVGELYKSIGVAHKCAFEKWSTKRLTTILQDATTEHQPPMVRGRRVKLRYAHQGGSNPPIIVCHGNQTDSLPTSYKRFLENTFRRVLKVRGTPIRFEFKTGDNPFADRRTNLTPRQKYKKELVVKDQRRPKKKHKSKPRTR